MSAGFRDLLLRLLEKDPEQRISLEEVRIHEFFKDLDWPTV
jgi:serine/threonine protein kinase